MSIHSSFERRKISLPFPLGPSLSENEGCLLFPEFFRNEFFRCDDMKRNMITKTTIIARAISYQLIGYGILLFLIVGDELFDFPHRIFGAPATPANWTEAVIEGIYIVVLCGFTLYLSWRFLKEIKFLEGFLPICSYCKKIRKEEKWTSLEEYMTDHSEALFSHGLCPECAEKYYGEFLHHEKAKGPAEGHQDKTS